MNNLAISNVYFVDKTHKIAGGYSFDTYSSSHDHIMDFILEVGEQRFHTINNVSSYFQIIPIGPHLFKTLEKLQQYDDEGSNLRRDFHILIKTRTIPNFEKDHFECIYDRCRRIQTELNIFKNVLKKFLSENDSGMLLCYLTFKPTPIPEYYAIEELRRILDRMIKEDNCVKNNLSK